MTFTQYTRGRTVIYGWKDVTRYGIRYWVLGPFSKELK